MPRDSKRPRLWLRPEQTNPDGTLRRRAVWIILDGGRQIRTGCAREETARADLALHDYIASKHRPATGKRHPSQIPIADVLSLYLDDVAPKGHSPKRVKQRMAKLLEWWGDNCLADVTGASCRRYVQWRTSQTWRNCTRPDSIPRPISEPTAANELSLLRAAINHHFKEGLCSEIVTVRLPPKSPPREGWFTRGEAARLLWAAWRARRRSPNGGHEWVGRHIARFILVGLYTGTRSAAICEAAPMPAVGRGWVDLDRGVFHRRGIGRTETKKRRPPVRLPPRLLAHMRRWRDKGIAVSSFVEYRGKPVGKIRSAWHTAVRTSGVGTMMAERLGVPVDVIPHLLRHTAATWLMQAGVDLWQAAGFLGMTVEQLEETYGHHHPDFQQSAATAITGNARGNDTPAKPGFLRPSTASRGQ